MVGPPIFRAIIHKDCKVITLFLPSLHVFDYLPLTLVLSLIAPIVLRDNSRKSGYLVS